MYVFSPVLSARVPPSVRARLHVSDHLGSTKPRIGHPSNTVEHRRTPYIKIEPDTRSESTVASSRRSMSPRRDARRRSERARARASAIVDATTEIDARVIYSRDERAREGGSESRGRALVKGERRARDDRGDARGGRAREGERRARVGRYGGDETGGESARGEERRGRGGGGGGNVAGEVDAGG